MASMPWFRVYSEILDDKKLKRIYRATEFSKVEVIGVWICLLSLANECEDRGRLLISEGIPYELIDLSAETGMPEDDLERMLGLFEKYNMLQKNDGGWEIENWDGRQFKSDNSTERVRKWREKQHKNSATSQDNNVKRYSNVIDTEQNRTESESDTEQEYIAAFCEITKIPIPNSLTHYSRWIQEVGEWINLGVTRADIKEAVESALTKKYTVARPASITSFLRGNIAENEAKQSAKKIYLGPDGEEIVI